MVSRKFRNVVIRFFNIKLIKNPTENCVWRFEIISARNYTQANDETSPTVEQKEGATSFRYSRRQFPKEKSEIN